MTGQNETQSFAQESKTMATGYSGAIFYGSTAALVSTTIFYVSGGTLQIAAAINGSTMAGATLAAATWFNIPTGNPPFTINGPAAFYIAAAGATCVAHVVRNFNIVTNTDA